MSDMEIYHQLPAQGFPKTQQREEHVDCDHPTAIPDDLIINRLQARPASLRRRVQGFLHIPLCQFRISQIQSCPLEHDGGAARSSSSLSPQWLLTDANISLDRTKFYKNVYLKRFFLTNANHQG